MKHVGKRAIIGALLKGVKTSCVCTMQNHTYLIKHGLFRWLLLYTYDKIARVHGVVKAKGSWATLDTPAQKFRLLPNSFISKFLV